MDIHEYQAKEILANFGVDVPPGALAYSPEQAAYRARELGGDRWVVKAQVHAGGRGKAGGVKVCDSDRAIEVAVSADLAITSVLEGHEPPQFEAIPANANLPDLGHQSVALYRGTARSQIIEPLCDLLRREFAAISGVDLRAAAE